MKSFDHDRFNDSAVERAIAGDPSGGLEPSWFAIGRNASEPPLDHLNSDGVRTRTNSIIALVLSIIFLVVALLSW